jgi:FxsC-like protein
MNSKRSGAGVGTRGFYFFLSYARRPPDLEQQESEPDLWVTTFFQDLCAQVRRRAGRGSTLEAGFMEEEQLLLSPEWTARVSGALGASEVFVPLYSPTYLGRSWPVSELTAFRTRLDGLPGSRSRGHLQPVLWVPLARGQTADGLDDALQLTAEVPEYAKNGLLAMCRLTIFREQYATILRSLAERIVQTAENRPLGRSAIPIPITVTEPTAAKETLFVVGTISPTSVEPPPDRATAGHGDRATAWRPFRTPQVLPVAEYVANVAQRLGLGTETVDLLRDSEALAARPGVALIDPWILAVAGGRARLQAAIKALPEWVVLLLLADENDSDHAVRVQALAGEAFDMLNEHQQHVVKYARDVSEFVQLVPSAVTQARRRFLNKGPMPPPKHQRPPRPSLRRPTKPKNTD